MKQSINTPTKAQLAAAERHLDRTIKVQKRTLKPCPFCGTMPSERSGRFITDPTIRFIVKCFEYACPIHPQTEWHPTIKQATNAWNTRKRKQS